MAVIIAVTKNPDMETLEFKAPKGLEIPKGINVGDTFEVMATVALGEEGELYLKEIDGLPITAEEEDNEKEEDPAQGGFLEAMNRRMADSEK